MSVLYLTARLTVAHCRIMSSNPTQTASVESTPPVARLVMREPTPSRNALETIDDQTDVLELDLRGRVPRALFPAALHHLEALRQATENLKLVLGASGFPR